MTGPGVEREPGPGLESRQAAGGEAGAGPGDQGVQPGDLAGAGQGGAGEGVGPGQEAGQLLQQEGGWGAAGGEERQEVQQVTLVRYSWLPSLLLSTVSSSRSSRAWVNSSKALRNSFLGTARMSTARLKISAKLVTSLGR